MRAVPSGDVRELRVAVLREGRLGAESRHAERLRIGPTEKADVVVQDRARTLFERRGGRWWLALEDLEGKVANGGDGEAVEDLRGTHGIELALDPLARGRLVIGGTTLLFQLVAPRPVMPKPQLPHSVKGGLAIDWPFTTSLVVVATLLLGLLIGLERADWPLAARLTLPSIYSTDLVFPEPEPPPAPVQVAEAEPPVVDESAPERTDAAPRSESARGERATRGSSERPSLDAIAAEATGTALALIGAIGQEPSAMDDLLADGMPTGDLDALLATTDAVGTQASDTLRARDTRGSGTAQALGALRRGGEGGPVRGPDAVREQAVQGPATGLGPVRPEEPRVFDDALVARRLRGVRQRVQRCYEREVTRDPTLAGRIDVELEVHPAGTTTSRVTQNGTGSRRLGECITAAASSLRFPEGPEGGSVRYAFPFVFTPQQ